MNTLFRPFLCGWLLLPALTAFAQDKAPPPTPTPIPPVAAVAPAQAPAADAVAPNVEAAAPAPATAPDDRVAVAEPDQAPLRRLDTETTPPASEQKPKRPARRPMNGNHNNDRVGLFSNARVELDETIHGDAVAILGDLVVDGEVHGNAVSILGDTRIEGTVHGEVVVVLGDVRLGPKARVDGKIVCVTGRIYRHADAYVGGRTVMEGIGRNAHIPGPLQAWWTHGLKLGRPLAFGAELAWLWIVTACTLAFYALLALLFPTGIRRTGDILLQRPVAVVFSAMFALPVVLVLFVLLLITVIGIPVALLVLPPAVLLCVLFGKAAIYGLIGRRLSGDTLHPSLAVLAGGLIFVLLYLVPLVGLALSLFVTALGFGCAITALLTSNKRPVPPTPPAAPARGPWAAPAGTGVPLASAASPAFSSFTPPPPMTAMGIVGAPSAMNSSAFAPAALVPAGFVQPSIPATPNAALPRAGFWIRTGAMLIDFVLFAAICGPSGAGPAIFPLLAAYAACMWKIKGTTIGGIVCGLRVVRLDDRAIDWPTAIVRALGCFLSLVVGGLGFVWVVFDDERQSWHDKISGTVVVLAPKGTSLV